MSSSRSPSSDDTGALQGMADTETQTLWYGGENADQDVRIRLVRDIINNEVDDGRTLAYLMVHSSRVETSSSYFTAALSQRWMSTKRKRIEELTLHVHGDVRLYTDCFTRMYNPFMVGFESVKYSVELLPVSTQLAYDDLMSSICLYLASERLRWSNADEMRVWNSLLSEGFPFGHAADLLERLDRPLTPEDVRPLITKCMQATTASSKRSSREAKELLVHLLTTARVQHQSPTPTFKQETVRIINEEFKRLLVQADDEIDSTRTKKGARGMIKRLEVIRHVLDMLVAAGMANEAVKWFVRYDACLRRLRATALDSTFMDVSLFKANVWKVAHAYAGTVLTTLKEVMNGSVYICDQDRSALLMKWLPILEWVYQESNVDVGAMSIEDYCEGCEEVTKVLVPTLSESKRVLLFCVYKEELLI